MNIRQDMILIPLDSVFGHKVDSDQVAIIADLQDTPQQLV
jgi:hypothetical protein